MISGLGTGKYVLYVYSRVKEIKPPNTPVQAYFYIYSYYLSICFCFSCDHVTYCWKEVGLETFLYLV